MVMQNKNINDISSAAVSPDSQPKLGYKDVLYQLEQLVGQDVGTVKDLVQNGIITEQQGHIFMNQLTEKAQQINAYKNALNQKLEQDTTLPETFEDNKMSYVQKTPLELFNQEKPEFFAKSGRADLLNYLKGYDMDKDEILQIVQLVEGLEKSAVENYLRKTEYEKSLNDENAIAKSKLTAYAQNAPSDSNFSRVFTREEIGNMSGDEFTKNEKAIMQQMRQGMIK